LEFDGGQLTLIRGCAAGGILEWDNTNFDWQCGVDDEGGAGVWTRNAGAATLYPTTDGDAVVIGAG